MDSYDGTFIVKEHDLILFTISARQNKTDILSVEIHEPGTQNEYLPRVLKVLAEVWPEFLAGESTTQKEELPIPERSKPTGGRKRLQSHQDAIQRLVDGQTRETNFYQWKLDYEEETCTKPDAMESGASELYRKSVWKRFTGKN